LFVVFHRSSSERTTTILDHSPLNDKGEDGDANEPWVVAEVGEDVVFTVTKLTSIELVEQLHEDKALEDNCVKLAFLGGSAKLVIPFSFLSCGEWCIFQLHLVNVFFSVIEWRVSFECETKKIGSEEKKSHQDDELVESLAEDVSPHDSVNDLLGLAGRFTVHECIIRWLGGKCEGGKSVHNKVNPEHLD